MAKQQSIKTEVRKNKFEDAYQSEMSKSSLSSKRSVKSILKNSLNKSTYTSKKNKKNLSEQSRRVKFNLPNKR